MYVYLVLVVVLTAKKFLWRSIELAVSYQYA